MISTLSACAPPAAALLLLLAAPAAGQPEPGSGIEFAAISAAPATRWRLLAENDSLRVEGLPDAHGSEAVYWTRVSYARTRRMGGIEYDVMYGRYVADCATLGSRLGRLVWMRGGAAVADTTLSLPADPTSAGSIGRTMVDLACAGAPPRAASPLHAELTRLADALAGGPEALVPLRGEPRRRAGSYLLEPPIPPLGVCTVYARRIGCLVPVEGDPEETLDALRGVLRTMGPEWRERRRSTQGWEYRHTGTGVSFTVWEETVGGRTYLSLNGWMRDSAG